MAPKIWLGVVGKDQALPYFGMSLYLMFKDMVTLAQKAGNLDLVRHLLDVQAQALDQQEEVYRLRQEVENLKKQLAEAGKVEVFHGVYWRRLEDEQLDGPFSPQRWDVEKLLVRLPHYGTDTYSGRVAHQFYCAKASQSYYVPVAFYAKQRVKNGDELPNRPNDH